MCLHLITASCRKGSCQAPLQRQRMRRLLLLPIGHRGQAPVARCRPGKNLMRRGGALLLRAAVDYCERLRAPRVRLRGMGGAKLRES